MILAVLADIHSNHTALEACLDEAMARGAEEYLFLGDYLGDLACPERTLARLEKLQKEHPCTFLRGNKEDYWIDRKNGKNLDWTWKTGTSGSGMLAYNYERLSKEQIEAFERLPIAKTMRYPGLPDFVICHGSPWKVRESLREDYDYIDALTERLETELTVCAHFHIQSAYTRHGKRIVNPGSVGVPLKSGGLAQFMRLTGDAGRWTTDFVTLPYDREQAIREMDEERLFERAPAWYRVTKAVLLGKDVSQIGALTRASALYERHTGVKSWTEIPEKYWDMALAELNI